MSGTNGQIANSAPGMDISICFAFPESPEEALPRLRGYGFEGIELWPNQLALYGAERWAEALKASDMALFQLCPYFNFMEGSAKIDSSREILQDFLAAARVTGCRRLRVFTGPPWGEGIVGANDATEQQWTDASLSLQEFCDIASYDGIELCLECHAGSLMEDSASTLKLIERVNRANLTVNLQVPFDGETWQESVAKLGSRTTHIHIHNWTKGFGEGDLTYLAEGVFDWQPLLADLVKGQGRHVTVSLEHVNHGGVHEPWDTARIDGPFLNAMRERLR